MNMESSLQGDINETVDKLNHFSIEDITSRHRLERKQLQAKIQALKKNAPKSDKKKRKEVLDKIFKLESDLEEKQVKEIKQARDESRFEKEFPAEDKSRNHSPSNLCNDSQQRVTKAQKRRDKKARDAREREEKIKASVDGSPHAPKAAEARKLQSKIKARQLGLFIIPSDGDCLYNAVRHQLVQNGLGTLSIQQLRSETANYIQANKESLIPFMTHPDSGNLLTDDELEKYCDDIRYASSWGGQIELKALSSILKLPIEVLQADGSPTILGAEFGGAPLIITYHRHFYSLGEHYNSTVPLAELQADEENNKNDSDRTRDFRF